MIGGVDVILPNPGMRPSALLAAVVRHVLEHWEDGIVQDGESAARYPSYWAIPFGTLNEVFVYRDEDTFKRSEREGLVDELHNQMLHVLVDEGTVTIVVDDANERTTATLLKNIKDLIEGGISWRAAA